MLVTLKPFEYFKIAAARGDAIAWLNLGNMYMTGQEHP